MKLVLKQAWSPGMNDPGQTYPEIYITQMTDNPGAGNFGFIYEAGAFVSITDASGNTTTVWQKGPGMLSQIAQVSGADYQAAIKAAPINASDSAYQSIRRILYSKLIAGGLAGTITDS